MWVVVFIASLFVLTKGADVFIKNAEKLGVALGLPAFVIGVLIVGIGTSLPELTSALVAVFAGVTEIVTANAIGSNITNILLIVGMLAAVGGKLIVTKDLIDVELPLFVAATTLFMGVAFDGSITVVESVLLAATFLIYIGYLFGTEKEDGASTLVAEVEKEVSKKRRSWRGIQPLTLVLLAGGLAGLLLGARYLVESVVALAGLFGVTTGLISLTAIALGTSLPELFVSFKALKDKKIDLAIGNIFGSNAFNILMAVGIPGLFGTLLLGPQTFTIALPVLAAASFIFLVTCISRNIYRWEGLIFLVFYIFFLLKLFGL